jgi:hypothetical protein
MPGPLTLVSPVSRPALPWGPGHERQDTPREQGRTWCHDGIVPRWRVVASPAALARAAASVTPAPPRAWATRAQPLFPWHAPRVATPAAAHAALAGRAQSWRDPQGATTGVIAHTRSAGQGRPTPPSPSTSMDGQLRVPARPAHERIAWRQPQGAGVVIGTHLAASHVSASHVIPADNAQSQGESGCRVRTDPVFVVSSRVVKQPGRMQGLRLVMT